MILEGIVTTTNSDGSTNVSPMGPLTDRNISFLHLRPYQTSRTYQNLKRHGCGVFHITDDVELIAHYAVGKPPTAPKMKPLVEFDGSMLVEACRWYAFRVERLDDSEPRTSIECEIVQQGRNREFLGFNRAKHAVIEAAILATRIGILPIGEIVSQFDQLAIIVDKTAGDEERRAMKYLRAFVDNSLAKESAGDEQR